MFDKQSMANGLTYPCFKPSNYSRKGATSIAPENLKIGHPKKNLFFPLIDVSGAMVFLGRVLFLGCFREGLFFVAVSRSPFSHVYWTKKEGIRP